MTFSISHPETKTIEIPFVKKKKNESELPLKKLTFCNTGTKKNEDFTYYDYVGHLEKFGYEWSKYGFNYEIKIQNSEIIKKLTLKKKKIIKEEIFKLMNQEYGICYRIGILIIILAKV